MSSNSSPSRSEIFSAQPVISFGGLLVQHSDEVLNAIQTMANRQDLLSRERK
jgi:hypothetical protein